MRAGGRRTGAPLWDLGRPRLYGRPDARPRPAGLAQSISSPLRGTAGPELRQRGADAGCGASSVPGGPLPGGSMADTLVGFSRRVSGDCGAASLLPLRAGARCGWTGRRGLPGDGYTRISVAELL